MSKDAYDFTQKNRIEFTVTGKHYGELDEAAVATLKELLGDWLGHDVQWELEVSSFLANGAGSIIVWEARVTAVFIRSENMRRLSMQPRAAPR